MNNPSQEKFPTYKILDSVSFGSQDFWLSDSQNQDTISLGSQDSWSSNSSCSQDSFICEDNYTTDEEFWNNVDKFQNNVEEKKQCE